MADLSWRGRSTGALYSFDTQHVPAALLDANGNPTTGTYNGETAIVANRDGSVQQPQAMGVPVGNPDIYSAYVFFSDWFTHTS